MQHAKVSLTKPIHLSLQERALKAYVAEFLADSKRGPVRFCREVRFRFNGKVQTFTADFLYRLIKRVGRNGDAGYRDLRKGRSGRKSILTPEMEVFILNHYKDHSSVCVTEHCDALEKQFGKLPETGPERQPWAPESRYYWAVWRFLRDQDWTVHSLARKGFRRTREGFGGAPAPQKLFPHEIWVSDTVTLKRIKLEHGGEMVSPQATFVMDASSRYCLAVVVHFSKATHAAFLKVLQRALLSRRMACEGTPNVYLCPEVLMTDNGSLFKNGIVKAACKELGILQKFSRKYCPRTNGRAEAFAKIIRRWMEGKLTRVVPALTDLKSLERELSSLVEIYNQRRKKVHNWMSPDQFLLATEINPGCKKKTRAQIVSATRALQEDCKLTKGRFNFAGVDYLCLQALLHSERHFTIVFDPGVDEPAEIAVVYRGEIIGVAHPEGVNDIRAKDWDKGPPNRSKAAGDFLIVHYKSLGILNFGNDKDPNRPLPNLSQSPKLPVATTASPTAPVATGSASGATQGVTSTDAPPDPNKYQFQLWDDLDQEAA